MAWMDYQNAFNKRNSFAQRAGLGYDSAGRMTFGGPGALGAAPSATEKTRAIHQQNEVELASAQNRLAQQNMLRAQNDAAWQAAHERNLQASEQMRRHQETMGAQAVASQKNNVLAGLLSRFAPASGGVTTTVRNW